MPGFFAWKYFLMMIGNAFNTPLTFMDRLSERLNLKEGMSEEDSNVIIAFVAIVSRAGTDIEHALRIIPNSTKPVVLVVLHHTLDPNFIVPDSRHCVNRSNIFTVDCLFHEDQGLLRCLQNDQALKAVTDYLMSKGVSLKTPLLRNSSSHSSSCNRNRVFWIMLGLLLLSVIAAMIYLLIFFLQHPSTHGLSMTNQTVSRSLIIQRQANGAANGK